MPHQLRPPDESPLVAALRLAGGEATASTLTRTLLGANGVPATEPRTGRGIRHAAGRHLHLPGRRLQG